MTTAVAIPFPVSAPGKSGRRGLPLHAKSRLPGVCAAPHACGVPSGELPDAEGTGPPALRPGHTLGSARPRPWDRTRGGGAGRWPGRCCVVTERRLQDRGERNTTRGRGPSRERATERALGTRAARCHSRPTQHSQAAGRSPRDHITLRTLTRLFTLTYPPHTQTPSHTSAHSHTRSQSPDTRTLTHPDTHSFSHSHTACTQSCTPTHSHRAHTVVHTHTLTHTLAHTPAELAPQAQASR